jgi:predicted phage terminase large subunit-like protein
MNVNAARFRRSQRDLVRIQVRENFYAFFRFIFQVLAPGVEFIDAPHYRVIATALQAMVTGEVRRQLIAVPPRHGKSLLSSVALPAWILGRNPSAKFIAASYGDQLAKDFALRTRDVMMSPQYRSVFPETVLQPGGSALEELRTTTKGFRLATSVGGVITGKGAHFAVIDDAIKASDANSDIARNAAYEWIKASLMSRFDKPKDGRVLVIGQRLHQDDPIGRLRDEGWPILEMPGEAIVQQQFDLGDGEIWDFQPGDLLFEEMFDHEALEQLRFDLGNAYHPQILQRPSPAGGFVFKLKHIPRYERLPPRAKIEKIVQSWDPAFVDNDGNAFAVCTTWAISHLDVYLVDVFRKRLSYHQLTPAILSLREKHNAQVVIIETSGLGKAVAEELSRLHGGHHWLVTYEPTLGKVERAIAETPKFERKHVHFPVSAPWLEPLENEFATFPMGKYKDQVDSTVQFLHALDLPTKVTLNLSAYPQWRHRRR